MNTDKNEKDPKETTTKITEICPPKPNVSFADATNGKTFEHVVRKYTRHFAVSFNVQTKIAGPNDGKNQEKALRIALEQFLTEGQRIDGSFGIMPWKVDKPLPTVYKVNEIKKLPYDSLIQYLCGPIQGRYIKQIVTGRNYKWRLYRVNNQKHFMITGVEQFSTP